MTKDEAQAVRQVLMQILMQRVILIGPVKRAVGLIMSLSNLGLVNRIDGVWCVTEKGKRFILDMDADNCLRPKEET